jgi:hypothetical protein
MSVGGHMRRCGSVGAEQVRAFATGAAWQVCWLLTNKAGACARAPC